MAPLIPRFGALPRWVDDGPFVLSLPLGGKRRSAASGGRSEPLSRKSVKRCLWQKKRTDFEERPRLAGAISDREPARPDGEQKRHDWRARTAPGNRFAATVVRCLRRRRMRGAVSKFSKSIRRQLLVKNQLLIFPPSWSGAFGWRSPHPPQCAHWGTFPQGKALNCRSLYNHQGSAPKRGNRGTVTPLHPSAA